MPGEPREQPRREARETEETREEKERVLVALHAYYQEHEQNTPLHRELAETIDEAKRLVTEALPYLEEAARAGQVYGNAFRGVGLDKRNENEIVLEAINVKTNQIDSTWIFLENLPEILSGKFFEKFNKDEAFQSIKKSLSEISPKLPKLKAELETRREKVFTESLVALGRGNLVAEGELNHINDGPYNIRGRAYLDLKTMREVKESMFGAIRYIQKKDLEPLIVETISRLDISEEEIMNLQKIEWSAEDQEKLRRLEAAVAKRREDVAAIVPMKTEGSDHSEQEHALLIDLHVAGYARHAYNKLTLPAQHRERAIQELKSYGKIV